MTDDGWQQAVFDVLKERDIELIGYVPDAGHASLIDNARRDPDIRDVLLTSEEEGIPLCAGAWLGGMRSVLLMQSSGVGNCVNMLSLQRIARIPMVFIVTMRGEYAEFNPWQVPMSSITERVLQLCNFQTYRVDHAEAAGETVAAAIDMAYASNVANAVIFSQQLLGRKKWEN
jgi:sulfopyruvate decarboxylase alpha subunit